MDGKNRSMEPGEQSLNFLFKQVSVSAANGAQFLNPRTKSLCRKLADHPLDEPERPLTG
jgi:hypothetical protein